jgi:hypothetical protein
MEIEQIEDQIIVRKMGKYFLFKPVTLKTTRLPYYMLVLKNEDPLGIASLHNEFNTFAHIFYNLVKN